jgi:hypothetical protein
VPGALWGGYVVTLPGRERRYHVRQSGGRWQVMVWWSDPHEFAAGWFPSRVDASALAHAVNEVALSKARKPGGSFYFNEWGDVIKPVWKQGGVRHYHCGSFPGFELAFELGEVRWINRAPYREDQGSLEPGDLWQGPRCGTPYWLDSRKSAQAPFGRLYRPVALQSEDDFVEVKSREYLPPGIAGVQALTHAISHVKGGGGGRFYVTEGGAIWAPSQARAGSSHGGGQGQWMDRYVGRLWDFVPHREWFSARLPLTSS